MSWHMGSPSEWGSLRRVAIKHARDAFVDRATIDGQWRSLNFTAPPDFTRAVDESDAFIALLEGAGATVERLPPAAGTTLDSIYTRDASIVSPHGVILCTMGKAARRGEPAAP